MNEMILISAVILGLAGSLHCVGMCGPIALSVPLTMAQGLRKYIGLLLYFTAKSLMYACMGFVLGLLGQQIALAGFQQALSITLGIAMLLFSLITFFRSSLFHTNRLSVFIGNKLSPVMGYFIGRAGNASSFMLGLLNGLLPCGLVYVALSAAIATGGAASAALFMLVFGLATIPLMLTLVIFTTRISIQYRTAVRRWMPAFTAMVAILLILRGLDLGIPYLSPDLGAIHSANANADAAACH
jgi:hypothetical protein